MADKKIRNIALGEEVRENVYSGIGFEIIDWNGNVLHSVEINSELFCDERALGIIYLDDWEIEFSWLFGFTVIRSFVAPKNREITAKEYDILNLIWDNLIEPYRNTEEHPNLYYSHEIHHIVKNIVDNENIRLLRFISEKFEYTGSYGSFVDWLAVIKKIQVGDLNSEFLELLFNSWLWHVLIALYGVEQFDGNLGLVAWAHNKLTRFARKNRRNAKLVSDRLYDVSLYFHDKGLYDRWKLLDYWYSLPYKTSRYKRRRFYIKSNELSDSLLMLMCSDDLRFQLATFKHPQKREWIHLQAINENGIKRIIGKTNSKPLLDRQHFLSILNDIVDLTESEVTTYTKSEHCRAAVKCGADYCDLREIAEQKRSMTRSLPI